MQSLRIESEGMKGGKKKSTTKWKSVVLDAMLNIKQGKKRGGKG